jgi:hypothetical protein
MFLDSYSELLQNYFYKVAVCFFITDQLIRIP